MTNLYIYRKFIKIWVKLLEKRIIHLLNYNE